MSVITYIFIILQALALVSQSYQQCYEIDPPEHGKISFGQSYSYYHVSCDTGYILHGDPVVYCEKNNWDRPKPTCIENVCEALPAPENGQVECGEGPLSVGKRCRFTCFDGYILQGFEVRQCMSNLRWSGLSTKCIPLSSTFCPLPPPLQHGTVMDCTSVNMPRDSQKCTFRCNKGYVLRGPTYLTCRSNGKLTDDEGKENFPKCVELEKLSTQEYRHERQGEEASGSSNRDGYRIPSTYEEHTSREPEYNPCQNLGGCEHICKNEGGRAQCRCRSGYSLAADQKHCFENSMLETTSDNNGVYQRTNARHEQRNNYVSRQPSSTGTCENPQCEQLCRIENGLPHCRCEAGYMLNDDKRTCRLNKPCRVNNGGCAQYCTDIGRGSKEVLCTCRARYTIASDRKNCIQRIPRPVPVPRPKPSTETCDVNNGNCEHDCKMTRKAAIECSCRGGFELHSDGKHCIEKRPVPVPRPTPPAETCAVNNGGCQHVCRMTRGTTVQCSCRGGYNLHPNRKHCVDIDECSDEKLNRCQHYCENTEGSFTCSCKPGYIQIDSYKCEGCRKNSYWSDELNGCADCPKNSHTNSEGKMSISDCICNSGYSGNPGEYITCHDINECLINNFGCSDTCVNIPGQAYCTCSAGYMLDNDNKTCIDVDECSIKNGGCEGICLNTEGSFKCSCPEGFTSSNRDHYSCDDIDECLENNGGCEQKCINYRGGYYCACETGYHLDSGLKNCTDVQCSSLPAPQHSYMECNKGGAVLPEMNNYPAGTTCTFNCDKGFKNTKNSKRMKCQKDGTWKGTLPKCESQHCSHLDVPENGDVHPSSCSTQGAAVKQKCTFTCRPGYKLEGHQVFVCKNNLTWNVENIPICKPVKIQPIIECPRDISVTLLPGKATHNVTVPEPTTNMENYEVHPSWVSTGKPVEFPVGVTKVKFTSISLISNNTAKCVTTVTVLDEEPPVFEFCPDDIKIEGASSDGELVAWEEPVISDNIELVSVFSILESNTTLTPGTHFVEYVARDSSGNTATCSFKISIMRINCSDLVDPTHGEANCMDWMFGKLCTPQCDDGYMRDPNEPLYYSCDDSGVWEPSEIISECLKFSPATSSACEDGYELKTNDETEEDVCVGCASSTIWSATTRKCERTVK